MPITEVSCLEPFSKEISSLRGLLSEMTKDMESPCRFIVKESVECSPRNE